MLPRLIAALMFLKKQNIAFSLYVFLTTATELNKTVLYQTYPFPEAIFFGIQHCYLVCYCGCMGNLLHISLANDAIRCQKVLALSYQFNLEKDSVRGSDMSKIPYIGLSNKAIGLPNKFFREVTLLTDLHIL